MAYGNLERVAHVVSGHGPGSLNGLLILADGASILNRMQPDVLFQELHMTHRDGTIDLEQTNSVLTLTLNAVL